MFIIERSYKSNPNKIIDNRIEIKTFKDSDSYGEFMTGPKNEWNVWRDSTKGLTKAGHYAFAGGKWHNVKSLDSSVLAHV